MTFITWACLRCVQELTTILGPQNRTQGSCVWYVLYGLMLWCALVHSGAVGSVAFFLLQCCF